MPLAPWISPPQSNGRAGPGPAHPPDGVIARVRGNDPSAAAVSWLWSVDRERAPCAPVMPAAMIDSRPGKAPAAHVDQPQAQDSELLDDALQVGLVDHLSGENVQVIVA